jgi:hypothetical protein
VETTLAVGLFLVHHAPRMRNVARNNHGTNDNISPFAKTRQKRAFNSSLNALIVPLDNHHLTNSGTLESYYH